MAANPTSLNGVTRRDWLRIGFGYGGDAFAFVGKFRGRRTGPSFRALDDLARHRGSSFRSRQPRLCIGRSLTGESGGSRWGRCGDGPSAQSECEKVNSPCEDGGFEAHVGKS
jgi:hypothetical protein